MRLTDTQLDALTGHDVDLTIGREVITGELVGWDPHTATIRDEDGHLIDGDVDQVTPTHGQPVTGTVRQRPAADDVTVTGTLVTWDYRSTGKVEVALPEGSGWSHAYVDPATIEFD